MLKPLFYLLIVLAISMFLPFNAFDGYLYMFEIIIAGTFSAVITVLIMLVLKLTKTELPKKILMYGILQFAIYEFFFVVMDVPRFFGLIASPDDQPIYFIESFASLTAVFLVYGFSALAANPRINER